ncbi:MAG: hypothetical protein F4Y69_02020 [Chloroflexi bacterium]|nr:hypothetical protein [Chloroflexota bacterium]MYF23381.1 hypothetical protein [Chloroflexota bacterium]
MVGERQLTPEQRRLLRLIGQMPLAATADLALIVSEPEIELQAQLDALVLGGWMGSLRRGMVEVPRQRWYLRARSLTELYTTDHTHLGPRELLRDGTPKPAIADILASSRAEGTRIALDHEHYGHRNRLEFSPFLSRAVDAGPGHEHPPWTATARGLQTCLRRLPMLETLYQLAPGLLLDGHLRHPDWDMPPSFSDLRLMRSGSFFSAVARYGETIWIPLTYAGLHATERALRRKQDHRFWNLDCYSAQRKRLFRISNRAFYEDPEQRVEPSALVVVAADGWAADLARRTLDDDPPVLVCTPDRRCSAPITPRPSRDLISDPQSRIRVGRPERIGHWLHRNRDFDVIAEPLAYRLFQLIAEFPAMRAGWLQELSGGQQERVRRILQRFDDLDLAASFEERYYLGEAGIRRAANFSRVRPAVIRSRHGFYLQRKWRLREQRHDDGVNDLVLQLAREGVRAYAGWRGEVNLPGLTQIRPDLLLLVEDGPFGSGPHAIEFERRAREPVLIAGKLRPYRRAAAARRAVPVLFVCQTRRARDIFIRERGSLPLLATTLTEAMVGPLTGDRTIWSEQDRPVSLHCTTRSATQWRASDL